MKPNSNQISGFNYLTDAVLKFKLIYLEMFYRLTVLMNLENSSFNILSHLLFMKGHALY
jgi:hypothetical protein